MILVSEENSLQIRHHAFSRPFHTKIFFPRCQRKHFEKTFYRSHYPNGMTACGLCFIWQPSFVKNYSACCSRHSFLRFFPIDSYHGLKISLSHRNQTEVSSLKNLSIENSYTYTYFCHHTAIYSFSDWFICFDFGYFFYNKNFLPFARSFLHAI